MSKELTPLEALGIIAYGKQTENTDVCINKETQKEAFRIVETALKRLEKYEKNEDFSKDAINYAFLSEKDKIKKLKALEIIKEKDIDVWLINHCDYENYCRIRKLCLENTGNADVCVDTGEEIINLPTKEEYELLKEVLL